MDFGAFPPEFNSGRMYAGPGPESLLAAAAAWNALAAEYHSVATSYASVISGLSSEWLGPSSIAMAAAATPYMAWLSTTAGLAELTSAEAQAAAGAFEAAYAMTVPPPLITANRVQLANLVSTNLLGQNTPAIAATEAEYGEMWAQDATAMYGYAASSAVIGAKVTPFTAAPETTNAAGLAAQGASTGGSIGNSTSTSLSKLVTTVPTTLQNFASPGSSTSTSAGSGVLNGVVGGSSTGGTTTAAGPLGGILNSSGIGSSLASQYLTMPAWAGISLLGTVVSPLQTLMTTPINNALTAAAAPAADIAGAAAGAADAAAGAAGAAAEGALGGVGGLADLGALGSLGGAASVGALSVPATWGWAATAPMLGSAPLGMLGSAAAGLASADVGAGFGFPFMFPGLPGAAAMGAGVGAGAAALKYGSRLRVMTRPPAAGYPAEPAAASTAKYPVPATFPTNGHAPPGYQPAIVYLPTNGNEPANA